MADDRTFRAIVEDDASGPLNDIRTAFQEVQQAAEQTNSATGSLNTTVGQTSVHMTEAHANTGQLANGLQSLTSVAQSAGGGFESLGSSIAGVVSQFGPYGMAAGAAITATAALGAAVVDVTQAAAAEEVGIARLNAALKANIPNWNGQTDAIEKVIAARQALAFDDGEQRASLAKLIPLVKDVNQALEIQRVAMDFAAGTGMDLVQATTLLERAYISGGNVLHRYGIEVDSHAKGMQVLTAVSRQYGGAAETMANTASGAAKQFKTAWDNARESIGANFLDATKKVTAEFQTLAERADNSSQKGSKLGDALKGVADIVAGTVVSAMEDLNRQLEEVGGIIDTLTGKGGFDAVSDSLKANSIAIQEWEDTYKKSMMDTEAQTGQTTQQLINDFQVMSHAASEHGENAGDNFKDGIVTHLRDALGPVGIVMDAIKNSMQFGKQAYDDGFNDADYWRIGLMAGLNQAEIEASIEVDRIAKIAMDARAGMGAMGWNNAVAFLRNMTAALERGLPLIAGYISNFVSAINAQLPKDSQLPIMNISTGGVPMLPEQVVASHSGGSGGSSGRHAGSGGSGGSSGPTAQQIADQQKQAAQTLQQTANEEALAKAKDAVAAAQKGVNDVTERYGLILGEIDNKIKAVKDEEASRLAGLQNQIDPLNQKLAQLKVASEGALARFDEQIAQANNSLKSMEVTARQALDPFVKAAKDAADALSALQHAGQMMDESFTRSLEGITEQLYQLQQAEDAATRPLDEAIRARSLALQEEQQAVNDLSASYDRKLKPLQDELALLQQVNTENQRAQQLSQMDTGIANLQQRLANARAGSEEARQLQEQIAQAQGQRTNTGAQFQLEDRIQAIEREKTEAVDAANQRLAQHQRELEALQREREAIQHNFDLQRQAITDRQTELQHEQTLFDEQQRDREEAAQRNVDNANRELAAQQAVWNQELQQQKDLIAGLQALRATREAEDQAAQKAVNDQITALQTIYAAVKTNYDTQVENLDKTKDNWTAAENAELAYAQSILTNAQGVQTAMQGYVDKTDAAARETDALQKYADAFKVTIGQAKDALNNDMTPAMSYFKQNGLQPVADMHNPDINGSLGFYMQNWNPENENGYRKQIATSIHGVGDAMTALLPIQEDRWKAYFSLIGNGFDTLVSKMSTFNTAVGNLATPGDGTGTGAGSSTGTGNSPSRGPMRGPAFMSTGGGGGGSGTAYAPIYIGSQTNYYNVAVSVDQALMPGEVPADPRAWRPAARAIAVALAEVRS